MEGAEKEKLFLRFKRLLAGFVDQKLPRFACPLPNSRQQKLAAIQESRFYSISISDCSEDQHLRMILSMRSPHR
ncbi:hypothetical protein FI178_10085 [Salmonella enterica subsp. enterica]|nr:hypothetical protein [Salmonella enterica subsp. enterica]